MNLLHTLTLILLSSFTIAYQIILMQFLSFTQWYHFAYMVISIALLGFGASGTLLCFCGERWSRRFEEVFPYLTIATGISITGSIITIQHPSISFDSYMIFMGTIPSFKLLRTYVIFTLPFLLAGTAIGLTFIKYRKHIGLVYFWNLTGAATGGVLSLILLDFLSFRQITALLGLFVVLCGFISFPRKRNVFISLITFLTIAHCLYELHTPKNLISSEYKDLNRVLLHPSAKIEHEISGLYGVLHVVSSPVTRFAPGLSLGYTGIVPHVKSVFINGDYVGPIPAGSAGEMVHIIDHTTMSLPYYIGPRSDILVLGDKTGIYTFHALTKKPQKVTVVEINPMLVNLMKGFLTHDEQLKKEQKQMELINDDPRGWIQKSRNQFDTVIFPVLYTSFGGTGMNALSEHYLFTIEALKEIWRLLTSDGVIVITCFVDNPPRYSLRLISSFLELLENEGIRETENHIVAVQSWSTVTLAIKKSAFTLHEVENIQRFCKLMQFNPIILPNEKPQKSSIQQSSSEELSVALKLLLSPEREKFIEEYDFHISPVTDTKPYFAQFLKLQKIPFLARTLGRMNLPFLEVGYVVAFLTLFQILPLALALMVTPALLHKKERVEMGTKYVILYFGGIGAGYMLVEMALINHFNLYFGFPIKTAAYVIAFVLLASGLGSYCTTKISSEKHELVKFVPLAIIPPLMILYAVTLYSVIKHTIGCPHIIKAFTFMIATFPVAFLMGMPFPLGMSALSKRNHHLMAWAWGVNGCLSVLGSVISVIISVEWGFPWLFFLAFLAYTISFLTYPGINTSQRMVNPAYKTHLVE